MKWNEDIWSKGEKSFGCEKGLAKITASEIETDRKYQRQQQQQLISNFLLSAFPLRECCFCCCYWDVPFSPSSSSSSSSFLLFFLRRFQLSFTHSFLLWPETDRIRRQQTPFNLARERHRNFKWFPPFFEYIQTGLFPLFVFSKKGIFRLLRGRHLHQIKSWVYSWREREDPILQSLDKALLQIWKSISSWGTQIVLPSRKGCWK